MLGAEEIPLKGKQIWSILALVDVDDFLALCVDVEVRLEKPQTVCVRPLWLVCPW